jgi:ribulose-phosphate 3-epimerase
MSQLPSLHISASILSADFAKLGEEVSAVLQAGADRIHIDVMDNHYVPNLTMGPMVCEALRQFGITAPMDVHLMVTPVDDLIKSFIQAGASQITFHPEASLHVDRSLQLIRDGGCETGLALNPATPLNVLEEVLDKLDRVLVMSVNPGFGGQSFIPHSLDKIMRTKKIIERAKHKIWLEVDGGIKVENIRSVADAGADMFVIGSALFKTADYNETLMKFRDSLGVG